jgi:outer membrane PBP1 activator LpoA protein
MKLQHQLMISVVAVLLTACGGETEKVTENIQMQTPAEQQVAPEQLEEVADHLSTDSQVDALQRNVPADNVKEEAAPATNDQSSLPAGKVEGSLPHGRLTGIIDTGSYKQAIINNDGQVIRLKKGTDWQGWTVKTIKAQEIVVTNGQKEEKLSLHGDFHAPRLSQAELERRQAMQEAIQAPQVSEPQAEPTIPPLELTEEQVQEMRSRLVSGGGSATAQ